MGAARGPPLLHAAPPAGRPIRGPLLLHAAPPAGRPAGRSSPGHTTYRPCRRPLHPRAARGPLLLHAAPLAGRPPESVYYLVFYKNGHGK